MVDALILAAAVCGLVGATVQIAWLVKNSLGQKEDEWRNEYDNDWE